MQFVVEKTSGASKFVDSVEGGTSSRSAFEITLDGYSAPVTAGKFAKLVRDGKFDSKRWSSGYLTLVAGKGADPGATLPLEILPTGVTGCSMYSTMFCVVSGRLVNDVFQYSGTALSVPATHLHVVHHAARLVPISCRYRASVDRCSTCR